MLHFPPSIPENHLYYGDTSIDPQAPIRIVPDNGHVGLYGVRREKLKSSLRSTGGLGYFYAARHGVNRR